jgi:predicted Zn-dependent peptidase
MDNLRSVSLGIWVDTGSRDEEEIENGVSHFIEHMIFRGTENRSGLQIAKELDAIGGLSNAFTGKESTCFHARVLDKHLAQLADILTDIFLRSKFDRDDVERERQVILQEIAMVEDTPEDNIHVVFNRNLWANHPIGMPILGTEENVSKLDRTKIMNYMSKFYVPEKILIVAAGNIDHVDLVSLFAPLFGSIRRGGSDYKREIPASKPGFSIQYKDLEQTHLCIGGKAPSLKSKKRFASAVFNTILGGNMSSRLFQEIRENRGLAYSVYSFLSSYIDSGMLVIYIGFDPKNINFVLEAVKNETLKICRGNFSKDDLISAKEHIIGGIYLGSESADSRMMRNAKNEFVFQKYIAHDQIVSEIEKVSADDVVEVSHEIFNNENINFVALGSLKEDDIDRGTLDFHS